MNLTRLWDVLVGNLPFMLALLPLVGAALVLASARLGLDIVRKSALTNVLLTLLLVGAMIATYDPARRTPRGMPDTVQMESRLRWTAERSADPATGRETRIGPDVEISLGIDGLSLWPVALVALLTLSALVAAWGSDHAQPALLYALLLALESSLFVTYAARDVVLFSLGSAASLLLMYFLVGLWGGPERRPSARKFLIYNLAGDAFVFFGLAALVVAHACLWRPHVEPAGPLRTSFDVGELIAGARGVPGVLTLAADDPEAARYWRTMAPWILWSLAIGFAIRSALVPFHTWLPDLLVEAPAAARVLLVGAVLPTGVYGLLRFVVPLFPELATSESWLPAAAVGGSLLAALLTLAHAELPRIFGMAAVAQLGLCSAGAFSGDAVGTAGSVLLAVSVGLTGALLLLLTGQLESRYGVAEANAYGGLRARLPRFAWALGLALLAVIGTPGLSGFVGRLLVVLGMIRGGGPSGDGGGNAILALWSLAALLIVAWAMLRLVDRLLRGPLREPILDARFLGAAAVAPPAQSALLRRPERAARQRPVRDLELREGLALAPLAAVVLGLGLWPQFFVSRSEPTVRQILHLPVSIHGDQPRR